VSNEDIATKMAMGIGIATGFLEAHRQNRPSDSHPSPFDRLNTALRYHPLRADGLGYAFALAVLQMNWYLREYRTWIQVEDRSFRELFEQFGECLSGQSASAWLSVHPDAAARADLLLSAPLDPADTRMLAYDFWQHRQRPDGSPDEDWFAAERHQHQLRLEVVLNWLRNNGIEML
jgi:hypothetical protein